MTDVPGGIVVTYESITEEMIQALDDEIDAIKNGAGGQQIGLQDGVKRGFSAGRHLYSFSLAFELSVPDDTPAQLIVGQTPHNVTVVTVDGFEIVLAVTEDLGERVPFAKLNTSPYYLLAILKTRLQETLTGTLKVNKDMAMRLFNQKENERLPFESSPVELPSVGDQPPNSEQEAAILKALSQRITFVWGPPGTGKTTTIKYLVPMLVQRGERVLITSHTNTAVDQVLKAAKEGLTPEQIENGVILRIGQPREADSDIEEILLETVVERRGANLRRRQEEIETHLAAAKRLENQWSWWDEKLKEVSDLRQRCDKAKEDVAAAGNRSIELQDKIQIGLREKELLERRLMDAREAGFLRRIFSGLNPQRIEAELEKKQAELIEIQAESKQLEDALPRLRSLAEDARQALDAAQRALEKLAPVPAVAEVVSQLQRCQSEVKRLEGELKAIQREIAQLAERVIREAKVIGATLSKLTTAQELYQAQFDDVIVDEASMIPQPHLWFASTLSTKRIVILGDFRQLAPICVADESGVALKRMGTSIYVESGIIDGNEKVQGEDPRLVSLRRQYRMHEVIGELANELVYVPDGNPLDHHAKPDRTDRGRRALPESDSPIVLCDTSSANPWCARLEGTYSRYNIYSAIVTIRLAEQAAKSEGIEIGIMSPYSSQARLLQVLAKEHHLSDHVKIATVHRFQGNEKDVIIVDLVDGPPFKPGTLLTKTQAKCLLNVAFTRAKGKLILVGNCDYFRRHSVGRALEVVLRYFGRNARIMDSKTVISGYEDQEVLDLNHKLRRGVDMGNPEGMSLYHEGTFYPAFEEDLVSAQKWVIIFSPFIQPSRTAQLIPVIRHMLEKGVEVHIFTRPARGVDHRDVDHEGGEALVSHLESVGVKVNVRKGLHEKLAFIDDRITWMGSLNILSHSHTTEQMIRLDNPRLTATFLEFNGITGAFNREKKREASEALLKRISTALEKRMSWPRCPNPKCGRPMVLRTGRFGLFFGCSRYPHCKETVNVPRPVLEAIIEELDIPCPVCGVGRMRLKVGPKGAFTGCSRYPDCKATLALGS